MPLDPRAQSRINFKDGTPKNKEGYEGEIRFGKVDGKLYQFVKYKGVWNSIPFSQTVAEPLTESIKNVVIQSKTVASQTISSIVCDTLKVNQTIYDDNNNNISTTNLITHPGDNTQAHSDYMTKVGTQQMEGSLLTKGGNNSAATGEYLIKGVSSVTSANVFFFGNPDYTSGGGNPYSKKISFFLAPGSINADAIFEIGTASGQNFIVEDDGEVKAQAAVFTGGVTANSLTVGSYGLSNSGVLTASAINTGEGGNFELYNSTQPTSSGTITIGTGLVTSSATMTFDVASGSIGDTQLEYKTGQNLRTSDTPQFTRLGIGAVAGGANEQLTIAGDSVQKIHLKGSGSAHSYIYNTTGALTLDTVSGIRTTDNKLIGSTTFTSGFGGSGWQISPLGTNKYRLEAEELYVRGNMTVQELIVNQISTTNGSLFVSDSHEIEETPVAVASSVAAFRVVLGEGQTLSFTDDDILIMEYVDSSGNSIKRFLQVAVTNYTSEANRFTAIVFDANGTTITNLNNGNADKLSQFVPGKVLARIGNTTTDSRQGGLYLTSSDTGSPYLKVFGDIDNAVDWGTSATNKVVLGKIGGLSYNGTTVPSDTYGLWTDSVYLTGKIVAEEGRLGSSTNGWVINSTGITAATNNANSKIVIGAGTFNNSNTALYIDGTGKFSLLDKFSIDDSGNLSITGSFFQGDGSGQIVGQGMNWRGTWAHDVSPNYAVNDAVYHSNNSYICKVAHDPTNDDDIDTGYPPDATNSWDLMAAQGTDGVIGSNGHVYKMFSVYRNAADNSAAGTPSGGSVNSGGVMTPPSNWSLTQTSPSAGNFTFVSSSVWKQTNGTGSYAIDTAWTAASQISGATGAEGPEGPQGDSPNYTKSAYKNASSPPSAPTNFGGTYASPSAPTGWSFDISTPSAGSFTYISQAEYRLSPGNGPINSTGTTPAQISGATGAEGPEGPSGLSSRTVVLNSSARAISYTPPPNNDTPTPSSITLSATQQNHIGTVYYDFREVSGSSIQNTTQTTVSVDMPSSYSSTPKHYQVETRIGSSSGSVIATDTISVYFVQSGQSGTDGDPGFTAILTNETHTMPVSENGAITYTNSGTQFLVYKGSQQLTAVSGTPSTGEYQVTVQTATNITAGALDISNGVAFINNHSNMTQDVADIKYTVKMEGDGWTVIKQQTFSKVTDGTSATPPDYVVSAYKNASSAPSTPNDFSGTYASPVAPSGWALAPSSPSQGELTYVSQATYDATINGPENSTGSAPAQWSGSTGTPGQDGQNASSGINYANPAYSNFENLNTALYVSGGSASVTTNHKYFGDASAYFNLDALDSGYANSSDSYNIGPLDSTKTYICSAYIRRQNGTNYKIYCEASDGESKGETGTLQGNGAWGRKSFIITPTSDAHTYRLRFKNTMGSGCWMYVDGIMIEEQVGVNTTPSLYVEPYPAASGLEFITDFINPPSNATGLYMVPSVNGSVAHLGYASNGTWKTYMDSQGDFYLSGTGTQGLTWDHSNNTLSINGSITVSNPDDFAPTNADSTGGVIGAGLSISTGGITMSQFASIKAGQETYDIGTGFFMGYQAGAAKLSLGNASGNKLTWDGTDLTVTGGINATSGSITGALAIGSSGMKIGENVQVTNDGIYISNDNYWFDSGTFKVGDGNNSFINFDASSGVLNIKADTLTFQSGNAISDPQSLATYINTGDGSVQIGGQFIEINGATTFGTGAPTRTLFFFDGTVNQAFQWDDSSFHILKVGSSGSFNRSSPDNTGHEEATAACRLTGLNAFSFTKSESDNAYNDILKSVSSENYRVIPYDTNKTYKLTIRMKTVENVPGHGPLVGVMCFSAEGVPLGKDGAPISSVSSPEDAYLFATAVDATNGSTLNSTTGIDGPYYTFSGYMRGTAPASGIENNFSYPGSNPASPVPLPNGTAYIAVCVSAGNAMGVYNDIGSINEMSSTVQTDIDWIKLEDLAPGNTIIDGGNIVTGQISADRLDVDSIFSSEATIDNSLTMGPSGEIHTQYKESATDSSNGIYIGTNSFAIGNVSSTGDAGEGLMFDPNAAGGPKLFVRGELTAGKLGDTQTVIAHSHNSAGYMPLVEQYEIYQGPGMLHMQTGVNPSGYLENLPQWYHTPSGTVINDGKTSDFLIHVRNGTKLVFNVNASMVGAHGFFQGPRIRVKKHAAENPKNEIWGWYRGYPGGKFFQPIPIRYFQHINNEKVKVYLGYINTSTNTPYTLWDMDSTEAADWGIIVPHPIGTLLSELTAIDSQYGEFVTDIYNPEYDAYPMVSGGDKIFQSTSFSASSAGDTTQYFVLENTAGALGSHVRTDMNNNPYYPYAGVWESGGGYEDLGQYNGVTRKGYKFKDIPAQGGGTMNTDQGADAATTNSRIAWIPTDAFSLTTPQAQMPSGFGESITGEVNPTQTMTFVVNIPNDFFDGSESSGAVRCSFGHGYPFGGTYHDGSSQDYYKLFSASIKVQAFNNG